LFVRLNKKRSKNNKSPKRCLGDLINYNYNCSCYFNWPKQRLETYCFCSVSYYYSYSFFPRSMNLSTADLRNYRTEFHETWWSYRYMFLVDPKVFRFVVKGVKAIICWICAVLWRPFWKWQPVEIVQCRESISTHISNFDDIGQCWIVTPHFYAVFWQPFWKWQTSWKFGKRRMAPLMVTYHYGRLHNR
jgi:hypothetical protein